MAIDSLLLEQTSALGQPLLRFYGWSETAASFGYFQHYGEVEQMTSLRPLVRRPTGGGLVPHAADWTYSLAIPPADPWHALTARESYQRVHQWMADAFRQVGIPAGLASRAWSDLPGQCFAGAEQHDLLFQGRKIAGAAQRRTRSGLLIQGSVQPPHSSRSRAEWEEAVCAVASRRWQVRWIKFKWPTAWETLVADLVRDRYGNDVHTRKR